ncbi:hypothetical protein RKD37_007981 [Streptomyces ambofaciens]
MQEGLEHTERRLVRMGGTHPRHRRRDPAAALAGQCVGHLQVRIDAGLDAPEELQDELVAVDQRGVGLLGVQQPRREMAGHRPRGVGLEAQGARLARVPEPFEEQLGGPGVVQRVVDRPTRQRPVLHLPDDGPAQPRRRLLAHAEQQLVAVPGRRSAAREGDGALSGVHQEVQTAREQLGHRQQAQLGHGPVLAREPALARQPLAQQLAERRHRLGELPASCAQGCGLRHGDASFPRPTLKRGGRCGMRLG